MVQLPRGGQPPPQEPKAAATNLSAIPRRIASNGYVAIPQEPTGTVWPERLRGEYWDGEQLVEAIRRSLRQELRAAFTRAGLVPPADEPEPPAEDGAFGVIIVALLDELSHLAEGVRRVVASGTVPAGREVLLAIAAQAAHAARAVTELGEPGAVEAQEGEQQ